MKKIVFSFLMFTLLASCGGDEDEKQDPVLNVSPPQIDMEAAGGSRDVSVTANNAWTAVSAAADWCAVSPASGSNNGTFTVTVQPNTALETRETSISVKSETLEKTINVFQAAAPLESVLTGTWTMTAQNSGDPNYDDLLGLTIDLGSDKVAVVYLGGVEVPGVGPVDMVEGTWSVANQRVVIEGDLLGIPVQFFLTLDQVSENLIACHMGLNLPGIFPDDGIPVVFAKQ
ncbi:MAG: BACON domain-containing protein [Tannerella sp.]|jgi:hypothetical protein|nr:BACON domain-containing protein [Tannerella sp.]